MKKIISLLTALSLLAGALSINAFAEEESYPLNELSELNSLNIISNKEPNNEWWEGKLTRGEMADLVVRLVNLKDSANGNEMGSFLDVNDSHPYYDSIMMAKGLGYITGYSDGNFYPEQEVTGHEAVKIVVYALGYRYKAQAQGGYFAGYLACAKEIGLLKGVKANSDAVLRKDIVKMLDNALSVPTVVMTGFGEKETYEIKDDVTILSECFDMAKVTGVVTANDITGIKGNDSVGEDRIKIGGLVHKVPSASMRTYLGKKVTAIYSIAKDGENDIVNIYEEETKKLFINLSDVKGLFGRTVKYTNNDKDFEATFTLTADIILNGVRTVYDSDMLKDKKIGDITLISTDNGRYDVVIINSYNVMTVNRIDSKNKILYDKRNETKALDLGKDDITYLICDNDNNQVSFSYIKSMDTITYKESPCYVEVYVSNKNITGVAKLKYKENGDGYFCIDEKELKINPLVSDIYDAVNANDSVKLSIDYLGLVADVEVLTKGGREYMFLVKLKNTGAECDPEITVKMFSAGRGISTHKLNNPVIINGKSVKNPDADKIIAELGTEYRQMVMAKLDEEENITELETAKGLKYLEDNFIDGFCRTNDKLSRELYTDPWTFSRAIYIKNETQILQIPKDLDAAKDDDFKVTDVKSLKKGDTYVTEAYNSSKNFEIPDVIIVRTDLGEASAPQFQIETPAVIVKKISQVQNSDGAVVTRVRVQQGSKEDYFDIDNDNISEYTYNSQVIKATDLAVGDVIRFRKDNRDYIRRLEVYEHNNLWVATVPKERNGIFPSSVARLSNEFLFVPHWFIDEENYGVLNLNEQTLKNIGGIGVIEAHQGRTPYVRGGAAGDLVKGDKLIVHIAYGQLIGIIIYK